MREIIPTGPVRARMRIPGSKSFTNRALVCAALADGDSVLRNASDSNDTALMANGLNQLGILARENGETFVVQGTGGRIHSSKFPIPVGNAGTTLRFLLSLAAVADGRVVFEGSERMAERPIDDLLDALKTLGVAAMRTKHVARYEVQGGTLRGGPVLVRGDKSSQFLSSILMVAPYAERDTEIAVEGALTSASYVAMTLEVMKAFGVTVNASPEKFRVVAGERYRPAEYTIEPDASGASYALGAAAIAGGMVLAEGLHSRSLQGDIGFAGVLREMGCLTEENDAGLAARRDGPLRGVDVDMNRMPDVVPTLAAVALFASGKTRVRNVGQLRFKESDRLGCLAGELRKLGARVTLFDDGLEIDPAPLHGAQMDTHDDHRLAMSFALIGLRVPGVRVENPDCVIKSFPSFWKEFEKLYGR